MVIAIGDYLTSLAAAVRFLEERQAGNAIEALILLCHKIHWSRSALAARASGEGAADGAGDNDPDRCDRVWHMTLRSDREIRGVDNHRVGDIL